MASKVAVGHKTLHFKPVSSTTIFKSEKQSSSKTRLHAEGDVECMIKL